ncbi:MAG: (Fe-S)-binding protein, partial [Longimicrobiales bacterium]
MSRRSGGTGSERGAGAGGKTDTTSGRDGGVGALAGALAGEVDKLSHCVHCGFCLPVCPTYTRLGDEADSPRGRLYLMRAVVEGRLDPGSSSFQTHIDRCLGCRACEPVCPSGVEYGHLLERAREVAVSSRPPALAARILLSIMGYPIMEAGFMALSRVLRWSRIPALGARFLPPGGWSGRMRLALAMLAASAPAKPWNGDVGAGRAGDSEGVAAASTGIRRRRVAILTGCVQEGLFSRVNRATVRVLEANGFEVVSVPDQRCCGALHAHGGILERARELARRNVAAFEAAEVEMVVVNAAGCGSTMKDYVELLEDDSDWARRARELSEEVRDVSEVLADVGPRSGGTLPVRVAYDPPCHLVHAQRVADAPRSLLEAIPGLEVVPVENADECCGGAGIYGVTHPELGGRIGGDKVDAVVRSGAEVVITGNPGCIMQIGAGLRMARVDVPVVHPIELLDESYRRAGMY